VLAHVCAACVRMHVCAHVRESVLTHVCVRLCTQLGSMAGIEALHLRLHTLLKRQALRPSISDSILFSKELSCLCGVHCTHDQAYALHTRLGSFAAHKTAHKAGSATDQHSVPRHAACGVSCHTTTCNTHMQNLLQARQRPPRIWPKPLPGSAWCSTAPTHWIT